jgi:RNA polymerase sigma-70 factor (ECF subfamily)
LLLTCIVAASEPEGNLTPIRFWGYPYLFTLCRVTIVSVTEAEFQIAFDQHKDAIYRFAWRMTNSAEVAEDIAQEVFLSLLRDPDRFDPNRGALRSFLFGIARNLALKRWRSENKWEELEDDQFPAQPVPVDQAEIAAIVGTAVQALPPLQREVLILAEYEELSLDEIALALKSEIGTVKSRLHRARENLRRTLAPLKPGTAVRTTPDGA